MKILRALYKTFYTVFKEASGFILNNLYYAAMLLVLGTPYLMYWVCIEVYKQRGYFAIGGEMFIPIFIYGIVLFLRKIAEEYNKGPEIPIPGKRFTYKSITDDSVSIDRERIFEMMQYVNDMENYLERVGKL